MINNKFIAVIAVIFIVLASVSVAYVITRDDGTSGNTVTDARGRQVEVPDEINSILAMKACSLQLVSFFDAVNKVTYLDGDGITLQGEVLTDPNRTHTFIKKDLLQGLPFVNTSKDEAVILANPDIIISSEVDVSKLDEFQKRVGIPVFAINADVEFDSDIMYSQLLSLGKLFGEEERAQELVDGIKKMISNITENVGPADEVSAYVCGMNFYGAASNTFVRTSGNYLPFEYSNVYNIMSPAANKQPFNTNPQSIIDAHPKLLFIDGLGLSATLTHIHDNYKTLKFVDAIADGKVYKTMVYKIFGTNWVNQLINVYYVAYIVHGSELGWSFADFEQKANEIIQLFYPGTDVTYAMLAAAQTGGGCGAVAL